jgi:phage baseplate assembly protein gpV
MTVLTDGAVIPSYLQVQDRGEARGWTDGFTDAVLRFGEVKALVYPDSELSYSKQSLEYVVDVQYRDGNGNTTTSTYRGTTTSTLFGGKADRFQATLRPDNDEEDSSHKVGVGSKVVLLCINGDQSKALILGGIREADVLVPKKEEGHNLFFEFNGVRFTIDKAGQPTLMFRGATKVDGSLDDGVDENNGGTQVFITKEGNLTIAGPDDKQYIRLNHKDKKLEIQADDQWQVTVNGKISIESQKDILVKTSGGKMDIETAKDVNIKSSGVKVGDGTDAWMLGTTYRTQEKMLHQKLGIGLQALSTMLQTVGSMLQAGSTSLMTPIYGGVLAKPTLTAAAVLLQQPIPQAISQMKSAIDSFEGNADQYLSKKNKTD